ncbi:hypothetical protein [Stenotrophomonas sp.]|uniref:hypothetical protein n=1 Tax=Stenotrophomonas sp. TaxID=69392 RepID=UPI00289B2720|nr:hypothetical protein [Stenotrophomonas sp.]
MRDWGTEPQDTDAALAFYAARMRDDAPDEFLADYMTFCWQAGEPGRVAALDLSDAAFTEAADRLQDLLVVASHERYRWTAPDFWRRYIAWADYGDEFSFDITDCRAFLQHNPAYIEPSFYLYSAGGDDSMQSLAVTVLEQCELPTLRNQYVRSVIENTLNSRKRHRTVWQGC